MQMAIGKHLEDEISNLKLTIQGLEYDKSNLQFRNEQLALTNQTLENRIHEIILKDVNVKI